MTIRKFLYEKADGTRKEYEVFLIRERNGYFEGLSTENITEEEKKQIEQIYQKFESDISTFSKKCWRKFSSANVLSLEESVNKF